MGRELLPVSPPPDLDERLFLMAERNGAGHPSPARPRSPVAAALTSPRLFNLVLAALAAVLAAAVAVASVNRQPPVYSSAAAVLIDQPRQVLQSDAEGVVLKLNLLRQKYAALADTELIAAPVAEKLDLPEGAVAGHVSVIPLADTLLFYVASRSPTAAQAEQVAEAVAEQLITYTNQDQDAHQIPQDQRIILTVVTRAGPAGKIEPTRKRAFNDGLSSALVALAVTYVLLQLVTVRRKA